MLLTIVTINLNNKDGLRKTIESVLSQRNCNPADVEYIIIDGASTDGSVDVIKEYAELRKDEFPLKISSWVSEPDTGIYNAMNKGIKKASGSLTALLNSGDFYFPDILYKVIEEHKKEPDAVLYGAMKTVKNEKFEMIYAHKYTHLEYGMIPHVATFVPLHFYKKYGYFDEQYKIAADYDFLLRLYTQSVKFKLIDLIVANFNLDGVSNINLEFSLMEADLIRSKYGFYVFPKKENCVIKYIKNVVKAIFPFLKRNK